MPLRHCCLPGLQGGREVIFRAWADDDRPRGYDLIVGFGGGPLYPLTVDAFYAKAGHRLDSVGMGAYCALASGVAVTLGPLALGVVADSVGLRWALLVVPCLALLGAVTQRPR